MKSKLTLAIVVLFWGSCAFGQSSPATEHKPNSPATRLEEAVRQPATAGSDVQILTDTQGVNFGPYLQKAIHDIKQHWSAVIPESAGAPLFKRGQVVIEFAITKDGQITGMHFVSSSGDLALDRAAYGGITASSPFSPLPTEFHGQDIGLRFRFLYNPDPNEAGGRVKREFPKPIGYVNDFAKVVDVPTKDQLAAICAEVDKNANAQIAIVTIQTLAGSPIEDYALHLFNEWGIGHKEDNRGLLILLSMAEHKFRIEVGLGFEALFPNDRVAKIGAEMVPDLKVQHYGPALLHCTKTLAAIAADEKHVQLQSLSP